MSNSIKQKTIASILLAWTLVQIVGSLLLYFHLKGVMYEKFDQDLRERSVSLVSMIREEPDTGELDIEWLEVETYNPPNYVEGRDYCELINANTGEIYHKSGTIRGNLPHSDTGSEIIPVQQPDQQIARCIVTKFRPAVEKSELAKHDGAAIEYSKTQELILYLATTDTVLTELKSLKLKLLTIWIFGVVLGSVVITMLVDRNLKPLDELREQIEDLDVQGFGKRITTARETTELKAITRALNALLQRVDDAFQREKVMTSNVAHELRTPVAGLMANLELANKFKDNIEAQKESTQQCLKIAEQMHWLVSNLLSMSRLDSGMEKLDLQAVDLPNDLRMWWRPFAQAATQKNLKIHWQLPANTTLQTDRRFLSVIMRNLFENAVQYAAEGGTITVSLSDDSVLEVRNSVHSISADTADHCFEPFWRNSHTHEGNHHNSGLGLSLCKKIATFMGIRIDAAADPKSATFCVRISF